MKPLVDFDGLLARVDAANLLVTRGKITNVVGLTVEAKGISAFIGEVCEIFTDKGQKSVKAEVVGFKESTYLLMPLGDLDGVGPGCQVRGTGEKLMVNVGDHLLGHVLDGLGRPFDKETLFDEDFVCYPVNNCPPNPLSRPRITEVFSTGIKSIDGFLTCGKGQRLGIFAGSGVGKSVLMGMISRLSSADVVVIGLIGERGREVMDFIEKDLGPEGLKKAVVVVATSDMPALVRLRGAFVASAIAEYFRDQGKHVLLLMDSVTRFAMAQREVGLAAGEPPATKGYTPSVFALLPRLLERAGNSDKGSITAFYTVLVDGDDLTEPVADAVRSILDGHVVLSRDFAEKNHYPAVDILKSISRCASEIISLQQRQLAGRLRELLATYKEAEDLINIGAYNLGSNPKIDEALRVYDKLMSFLAQAPGEASGFDDACTKMRSLLS